MSESVAIRGNAIDDPQTSQAIMAILQSVVLDLAAIKLWANTHVHTGAASLSSPTTVATTLVGNLNTTA